MMSALTNKSTSGITRTVATLARSGIGCLLICVGCAAKADVAPPASPAALTIKPTAQPAQTATIAPAPSTGTNHDSPAGATVGAPAPRTSAAAATSLETPRAAQQAIVGPSGAKLLVSLADGDVPTQLSIRSGELYFSHADPVKGGRWATGSVSKISVDGGAVRELLGMDDPGKRGFGTVPGDIFMDDEGFYFAADPNSYVHGDSIIQGMRWTGEARPVVKAGEGALIALSGQTLFWATQPYTDSDTGKQIDASIMRASAQGKPEVIANLGQERANAIAADATYIYVATQGPPVKERFPMYIRRVPVAGGKPQPLANEVNATRLLVSKGKLFGFDQSRIFTINGTGHVTVLFDSRGSARVTAFATDGEVIYFVTDGWNSGGTLQSTRVSGGPSTTLVSNLKTPQCVTIDEHAVYFGDQGGDKPTIGRLMKTTREGRATPVGAESGAAPAATAPRN